MRPAIKIGILAMVMIARLHAAGSRKAAMADITGAFEANSGVAVRRNFKQSRLLRQRIGQRESTDIFASTNNASLANLADRTTP